MTLNERTKRIELLEEFRDFWVEVGVNLRMETGLPWENRICREYLYSVILKGDDAACVGCPIMDYTTQSCCCGTPYELWSVRAHRIRKKCGDPVYARDLKIGARVGYDTAFKFRKFIEKVLDKERKELDTLMEARHENV